MEVLPDPQVDERASRRRYSAQYELDVLAEYEQLDKVGKGALLWRGGPCTSLITAWREQLGRGTLAVMEAATPGPRPVDPLARENERFAAENAWLADRWPRPQLLAPSVLTIPARLEPLSTGLSLRLPVGGHG